MSLYTTISTSSKQQQRRDLHHPVHGANVSDIPLPESYMHLTHNSVRIIHNASGY